MTETIDTANLRALAEAATPGPWAMGPLFNNDGTPERIVCAKKGAAVVAVTLEFGENNPGWRDANAAFVTAANPATIIALLDRLAAADARNATLTDDAARYQWLRRWKGQEHEPPFTVQHEIDGTLWGGDLDVAIDAARAAASISTKEGDTHADT